MTTVTYHVINPYYDIRRVVTYHVIHPYYDIRRVVTYHVMNPYYDIRRVVNQYRCTLRSRCEIHIASEDQLDSQTTSKENNNYVFQSEV